jgi:hypothetical protein
MALLHSSATYNYPISLKNTRLLGLNPSAPNLGSACKKLLEVGSFLGPPRWLGRRQTVRNPKVYISFSCRKESRLYDFMSNDEDDNDFVELANISGSSTNSSPKKHGGKNKRMMAVNNFIKSSSVSRMPSSSEDDEELEQQQRLDARNPMFPQI